LLPSDFGAQRSVVINAPAEKIYPLVATPKQWPNWAVWQKREPTMDMKFGTVESGAGAEWSWASRTQGSGRMKFLKADAPKQLDYELFFIEGNDETRSTGSFILAPEGQGTKVTWTFKGNAGGNPISRWFGFFIDKLVGPDFEAGLEQLKSIAE
jgi:uncharacterized protein YndB with AHSA1/START domain